MGFIKKEIFIGFVVSLITTACSLFIYLQYISELGFKETFQRIVKVGVLPTVIALAAIPNLIVFFLFLRKNKEYRARGVLMAIITTAFLIMILKFL